MVNVAPQGTRLVLLAALLVVPGCEPDECDLDFQFSIEDTTYQLRLDADHAQCSFDGGYGLYGQGISYLGSDGATVQIRFPSEFSVGVFPVSLTYINATGKPWYSQGSDLTDPGFESGCVATVTSFELVDWISNDHYRIRGVIDCALPLLDTQVDVDSADQLFVNTMAFNVYTGILGI